MNASRRSFATLGSQVSRVGVEAGCCRCRTEPSGTADAGVHGSRSRSAAHCACSKEL